MKKFYCTEKKSQFLWNPDWHSPSLVLACPNCNNHGCDFGPVVEPDEKQKKQVESLFHGQVPGLTPGATIKMEPKDFPIIDHSKPPSKYHVPVIGIDTKTGDARQVIIDVYAVQHALEQTPQVAHSFKKLWKPGARNGGKSYKQDIEEARTQLEMELNRIELQERFNG